MVALNIHWGLRLLSLVKSLQRILEILCLLCDSGKAVKRLLTILVRPHSTIVSCLSSSCSQLQLAEPTVSAFIALEWVLQLSGN